MSRNSFGVVGLLLALLIGFSQPASAKGLQDDIDQAIAILERIQQIPEKGIPEGVLANARGLAILTVTKAGFIFSVRGGKGLVVARRQNGWTTPSAVGTGGAGFGFQIGAQVSELIFVLNTPSAVRAFSRGGNIALGGELSVAAGPVGRNIGGAVAPQAAIYTYSRSQGVFAGISLEGTVVATRKKANSDFYGRPVEAATLLGGGMTTPIGAQRLVQTLNRMTNNRAADFARTPRRREALGPSF